MKYETKGSSMACIHNWIGNICSECGVARSVYAEKQAKRMEWLAKEPRDNTQEALWIYNRKRVSFEDAVSLAMRNEEATKD